METLEQYRWKQCQARIRFTSPEKAQVFVANGQAGPGKKDAYPCMRCKGFHLCSRNEEFNVAQRAKKAELAALDSVAKSIFSRAQAPRYVPRVA